MDSECKVCGRELTKGEAMEGVCFPCKKKLSTDEIKAIEQQGQEAMATAQADLELRRQNSKYILLTTETNPDLTIKKRLEIITAECVFGMNIFRDFFASVTDFLGGRSNATQKVLRDARKRVLDELRMEAAEIGANAVVAVRLDYSEISGKDNMMLFVVASGTAVIIESN